MFSRFSRLAKITWLLVVVNIVVWLAAGNDHGGQIGRWSYLPATTYKALDGDVNAAVDAAVRSFTEMFVHAPYFSHVGFNMLLLLVFGRSVEKFLGARRYLATYLLSGFADTVVYTILVPDGGIGLGASSAVSGIMGGYLILCFDGRFWPAGWGWGRKTLRVLAILMVVAFLALTIRGVVDPVGLRLGGFTHLSHLAGYLTGVVLSMMFCPSRRRLLKRAPAANPGAASGRVLAPAK